MIKRIRNIAFICIFAIMLSIINIENVFASSKIELTDIVINEKSSTIDATISDFSSDNVETDIVYHKFNDYVEFKLTIHNNDSKDYIIDSIVDNNTNPYIEFLYDDYSNTVLRGKKDVIIYIKSKYVNELNDLDLREQQTKVKFTINFVNEDGDPVNVDIDINPATGDSIYLYLEVLGVSVILLLLIRLIVSKSDNERVKKLFLMIIVYALLTPVCMRALEIGVSVTFNNSVNINDKVKVTYKNNGEDNVSVIDYNTKAENKTVPDRDGYRFDGWFLNDNKFDFETKIVEDIELVAKYTKMVYNISYNMNGGNASNPGTYKIDALLSLFTPGGIIYVDNILVDEDNYTVEDGLTITFKKEFMDSLESGTHGLKVEFNNGDTATATFKVVKDIKTSTNPKTNDNLPFNVTMLIISIICLICVSIYAKKTVFKKIKG